MVDITISKRQKGFKDGTSLIIGPRGRLYRLCDKVGNYNLAKWLKHIKDGLGSFRTDVLAGNYEQEERQENGRIAKDENKTRKNREYAGKKSPKAIEKSHLCTWRTTIFVEI